MNTYSHDRPCPKCGQGDIRNHFYAKGEETRIFINSLRPKEYAPEDTIQRICRNCSFSWDEKPLDVPIDVPIDVPASEPSRPFIVGDRVKVIEGGAIGTVKGNSNLNSIAVEFDVYHIAKHTCRGLCKEGYGYWYNPYDLEHLNEEEV